MVSSTANEQLLTLNHEIRQTEAHLEIARRRKRWSNLSLISVRPL